MALAKRVEELEQDKRHAGIVIVHVMPDQTEAQAMRAHRRAHGPIPPDAEVVVIHHTFKSSI